MHSRTSYNEQIKLVSNVLQNLGTGLLAALVGVLWSSGYSFPLVFWGFGAILLFAMAYVVLTYLEEEG